MNTLFLIFIFFSFSFTQSHSKIGLRSSLNLTSYNGNDLLDMGATTGFSIGGWYQLELHEKWAIQPELIYSARGGLGVGPATDDIGLEIVADITDKLKFLEIPVSIIFNSSENVSFGAGPYIAFLLDAERESIFTYPGRLETSTESLKSDQIEKTEFGLLLSLIFKIGQFDFSTRFQLGLTNITTFDPGDFDLTSNNLQIALGYSF